MTKYKHVGLHPEELVGGVMIGPGEEVDLSSEQEEENQRLIDEGILMSLSDESKTTKKKEES
jgi:hypothetical protein